MARLEECGELEDHDLDEDGSSIEDAGADFPRSGSFGPDSIWIHASCWLLTLDPRIRWLRILCISILRFPPYGSTLYNLYKTTLILPNLFPRLQ